MVSKRCCVQPRPDGRGPERKSVCGIEAIACAIASGAAIRLLLVDRDDGSDDVGQLIDAARSLGAVIWRGSSGDLRRMNPSGEPQRAIAMLGPVPETDLERLLARGGAVWLLHRAAYPSNVGFAIRTAEVAGSQGIVIDAAFNHDERSRAAHVSMGAHRVMPVLWARSADALAAATRAGHRLIAVEDSGARAPWEVDLTGAVMLVFGNERDGIDAELLARCDDVVRLPMAGFVPSYNVHAAISALAYERLRQLGQR